MPCDVTSVPKSFILLCDHITYFYTCIVITRTEAFVYYNSRLSLRLSENFHLFNLTFYTHTEAEYVYTVIIILHTPELFEQRPSVYSHWLYHALFHEHYIVHDSIYYDFINSWSSSVLFLSFSLI